MEDDAPPVFPWAKPETSLRDALEALRRSPSPALPILDPRTGQVLAVLSRQEPPRLGGMATPLGVYLHDGVSSGGAGFWGLFLMGVTMSALAIAAQALAHGLMRGGAAHLPALHRWETRLPVGFQMWLSAISPCLSLPLAFLMLRLLPLSGIHAAEHQVVHCIERAVPLVPDCVRIMPRVHPRCGTNLFAGFTLYLMLFLAVFCGAQAEGWPLLDAASLSALLAGPVTLLFWRRVGGWAQHWFATRPATDGQIQGAIRAAEQVLSLRRRRLEAGTALRFPALRWVWALGLGQVSLGYLAVLGLSFFAEGRWPGLARWLET